MCGCQTASSGLPTPGTRHGFAVVAVVAVVAVAAVVAVGLVVAVAVVVAVGLGVAVALAASASHAARTTARPVAWGRRRSMAAFFRGRGTACARWGERVLARARHYCSGGVAPVAQLDRATAF